MLNSCTFAVPKEGIKKPFLTIINLYFFVQIVVILRHGNRIIEAGAEGTG